MSKASEAIFDNNCAGTNRRNGTHSVPGWNEHVNELHNIARQSFMEWIVDAKPKHGAVFDDMKPVASRQGRQGRQGLGAPESKGPPSKVIIFCGHGKWLMLVRRQRIGALTCDVELAQPLS